MVMCMDAFRGRFRVIHTQREATSAHSFQKLLCDDTILLWLCFSVRGRFGCSRQHKKKTKSRRSRYAWLGAERRHDAGRCFLPSHSQSIFVEATHYTRARILWQLTATPNASY
jgi:hypothetical protein